MAGGTPMSARRARRTANDSVTTMITKVATAMSAKSSLRSVDGPLGLRPATMVGSTTNGAGWATGCTREGKGASADAGICIGTGAGASTGRAAGSAGRAEGWAERGAASTGRAAGSTGLDVGSVGRGAGSAGRGASSTGLAAGSTGRGAGSGRGWTGAGAATGWLAGVASGGVENSSTKPSDGACGVGPPSAAFGELPA